MTRHRSRTPDDGGASLIMALVYLTGVGLVVGALLTYTVGALGSGILTGKTAQSSADIAGAMQTAINDVRNSIYNNDTSQPSVSCLGAGNRRTYAPLTAAGVATLVTCSPVGTSGAGSGASVPITGPNRPPAALITLGRYDVGAAAGLPPADPTGVTVTPPGGPAGTSIIVTGTGISGATAIQVGTASELATATGDTFSPCPGGVPAAGCFTGSGNTLNISAMPSHPAGVVQVKIITLGTSSSASYTYLTPPLAPAKPTATAGASSATVTWTAPNDGGSPITEYVVTPTRAGVVQTSITYPASPLSRTLTDLTVGASYTFTVLAVNAAGNGALSPASNAVVPFAVNPDAPTIGSATAGTLAARLSWTEPADDGGSAITGYVVTPYKAGVAQATQTFLSAATTQIITGLSAGSSYTFRVSAKTAIGTGPTSGLSNAVTINANPTLTYSSPLPSGRIGTFYSRTLTSGGGTAPFTWTILSGSLPAGLSLGSSTGTISGTPRTPTGTFTFTVKLTDSYGAIVTKSTSLSISFTPAPIPTRIGTEGSGAEGVGAARDAVYAPVTIDHSANIDDVGTNPGPKSTMPDPLPAALRANQKHSIGRRPRDGDAHPHPRRKSAKRAMGFIASLARFAAVAGLVVSAVVTLTPGTALADGSTLFDQSFKNNTANGQGAVAIPGLPGAGVNGVCLSASGNPGPTQPQSCSGTLDAPGAGTLRLTDVNTFKTGGLFAANSMPISLGLDVTFNMYQYGGTMADGIAMTVAAVDPAIPVSPEWIGQPGGALGYSATGTSKGLAHGYMGFGFDVYGNFSSNVYEGTGCTDPAYISSGTLVPGQVVIRGPGHGYEGYCAINSTATSASPPSAVVPIRGATRALSKVPAEVVINPSASTFTTASGLISLPNTYQLVFTPVGQAKRTLTGTLPTVPAGLYPNRWVNPRGYPKQLAFGWVGSTGASTDFHEVDVTHVTTLAPLPAPELVVGQTGYTESTLAPGDPVTFAVTSGIKAGTVEPAPVTITETLPAGLVPVAAYGTDWECDPPVGQTISCVNTNVPFPAGSTLPPLTINATVTAAGLTPLLIQTNSIVSASSRDAETVYGGETGWLNAGDAPLRGAGPVYSNSTILTRSGTVGQCTSGWPIAAGTTDCNGVYVDGDVIAEKSCTGQIVTPTDADKACNTRVHTAAGDDPAIAAPASYVQPTTGLTAATLPTCVAGNSVVTFAPGYYDNAVGLSALTSGAAVCKNKTFWFAPGVYYFDFRNAEMPTTGGTVVPNGPNVWTFNDATSVIVGGTKQGWTTTGVTADSLPGACVSPLRSITAVGVQFVFGGDSQFYQRAGSMELCGTYSATKPPVVLSGATGLGGTPNQATLAPASLSSISVPGTAPAFTPIASLLPINSATDSAGPTVTNLPANSSAALGIESVSGISTGIPARSVLDTATVTVTHAEMNAAIGTNLKLVFTSSKAGSVPITKYLTMSRTSAMVSATETIDLTDELAPDVYAYGANDPFTLDVVLTTSSATQSVTEKVDFLKMNISWRSIGIRAQSDCVIIVNGCSVMSTTSAGALANELYFQGTVYMPKAKVSVAIRTADGSVFADGVVARAFVLDSDAYAGSDVYDGVLIRVPTIGAASSPLQVYLTAWRCTLAPGSCSAAPPGTGWKLAGRSQVTYTANAGGVVVSGQRDVAINSWQISR